MARALGHSSLSVAMVTARFPPMDSTGTIRVESLREHLPTFDNDVVYVTISPEWMVQQASDLDLPIRSEPDALYATAPWDPITRFISRTPLLRRLQRWCLVPDVLVSSSTHTARTLADYLRHVDLVYATGPPFSAYRTARLIAELVNAHLIIELRDPPMMDRRAAKRGGTYLQRMRRFEQKHVLAADAVVTLTPGVKSYLLETYPEVDREKVVVIPNGSRPAVSETSASSSADFSMLYAGSLRSGSDVQVLREIAATLGDLKRPGTLRLVGSFPDSAIREIEEGAPGRVQAIGRVNRQESIEEMRSCSASLVIAGDEEWWWIGRKVIESLMHAPRILAVAPPGDLTDLLNASAKSVVLPRGFTSVQLEDALESVSRTPSPNRDATGEPRVPTDSDVALAVSSLMRAVVDGRQSQDWEW